jgi:HNH endonuclease
MSSPKPPVHQSPRIGASIFERGFRERLGRRHFGKAERQEASRFFGGPPLRCAYCGIAEAKRWDHLVPVRAGGETVLGNMVPACGPCDDSKAHRNFETWLRERNMDQNAIDVEEQLAKLHQYMQAYRYVPTLLEDRLTKTELLRFGEVIKKLAALRMEADILITEYKSRASSRECGAQDQK